MAAVVNMAKLVFGLNQSLDGYVDHMAMGPPDPVLFHHFIEQVRGLKGFLYGRTTYEIMRYWDAEQPDWDGEDREFAAAWTAQPKWVVSRSKEVGDNATLIAGELERSIRALKAEQDGEIFVGGPKLAGCLTDLGLIDEYRMYVHPVVLGQGQPYFTGPRPRLRLLSAESIGADVVQLRYVPA